MEGVVSSDGQTYPFNFQITYRAVFCNFDPVFDLNLQQTELNCDVGSTLPCKIIFNGASNLECAYTLELIDKATGGPPEPTNPAFGLTQATFTVQDPYQP